MSAKCLSLPVLNYHSVCDRPHNLSVPTAIFEAHCRTAAENGWFGVSLEQAEEFFLRGRDLPPRSFLITLDDGYLDNYVYAWPILRKYGHKAVIFPVADSISAASAPCPRPTLEDVWGGVLAMEELPGASTGEGVLLTRRDWFFTWDEARLMLESGVIAFGGHSLRHGAVFTGPEHEGFLCPKSSETPFSYDGAAPLAWGMPCFRRGAELTSRAFMPAEDLLRAVSALVPQEEAAAVEFLRNESNLRSLRKLTESFRERAGRYETEQEQEKRVLDVFEANRSVLSRELGHQARSFCWPWGANNSFSLEKGREAGFQVFYAVCPGPNPPGRPAHVKRFNAKRDIRKNFNRMRVYSRPWLGAFYQKIR